MNRTEIKSGNSRESVLTDLRYETGNSFPGGFWADLEWCKMSGIIDFLQNNGSIPPTPLFKGGF
ncbi:hypothetical protein AM228_24925 [Planktothricoides sp. SR001]|nr:hypothetical protein AM228_24925 [Planktothricoides sp. SR001]